MLIACYMQAYASVRDLWAHQDLGLFSTFSVALEPDGASKTYTFTHP